LFVTNLNMKVLSNVEIRNIAKRYNLPIRGIFLRDGIPQVGEPKNGFYVFNLDRQHAVGSSGTHWTCMFCTDSECMYFDSFGCPASLEVESFIKRRYNSYLFNDQAIQDLSSSSCGWFCLAFGLACYSHVTQRQISLRIAFWLKQFAGNTMDNERKLHGMFGSA